MQAVCTLVDPLIPIWDADLEDLSLPGKQHSPISGMGETDYLECLLEQELEEGARLPNFPADDLTFPKADFAFRSPNLDDHGIDVQLPHSDALSRDGAIRGMTNTTHSLINIEQRSLPHIAIRQQQPQPHVPALDFAYHHRELHSSQARVRPHTALPAVHTGPMSNAMHMPVIPERPNNMQRTRSCPSNAYKYLPPSHFGSGASPHQAHSNRPPCFHPGRVAAEPEYRHQGAMKEEDPASPPRRKGKGGRQRAPPPDASTDPKRAKRILANRASAAKSKEKQKAKVQELEEKREVARSQIKTMQDSNRRREAHCRELKERLNALDKLDQDHRRLKDMNRKLTEFRAVLVEAMRASDRDSWTPSAINPQHYCLPQNMHSEAPVNVHAFSSNSMLSGPPAFKGGLGGPETPDLEIHAGSLPQLSDSYEQILCEGSTSPPDLHPGSGQSAH